MEHPSAPRLTPEAYTWAQPSGRPSPDDSNHNTRGIHYANNNNSTSGSGGGAAAAAMAGGYRSGAEARQRQPGQSGLYPSVFRHSDGAATRDAAEAARQPVAAGSSVPSMPWTLPGAFGGLMLGTTVAGPVGAVVGTAFGIAAGLFRDFTGKSVAEAWFQQSDEEKARFLQMSGFAVRNFLAEAGPASAPFASADPADGQNGLSVEDLDAIEDYPAAEGEPQCILCYENKVNVVFQPCGHAQVCSTCAVQVMRMSYTGACPVCTTRIDRITKVFIAPLRS